MRAAEIGDGVENARAAGESVRARSSMNGSISRKPMASSDSASAACSHSVK